MLRDKCGTGTGAGTGTEVPAWDLPGVPFPVG